MDSTELLHILVEGLTSDLTGITKDDIPGLLDTAKTMKEMLLTRRELDTKWEEPIQFLDVLLSHMKDPDGVGDLSYEQLSDKRIRLSMRHCGPAQKIHKRRELGPVCPKVLMVAAMLMAEFPRRKIKLGHSTYYKDGASSDLVFG